jgi:hypothetical protein
VANAEIHRFADQLVQLLHIGQCHLANVDPRLDDVAQFEKSDTQRVGAGVVVPFDECGTGHHGQDAMRSGGMQAGTLGQDLETHRCRHVGQHIEE